MMSLNPNNFYHSGAQAGPLTSKLRDTAYDGTTGLVALLTALSAALTAASATTEAGKVDDVITYLNASAANYNGIVAPY
jgi:hypothetical protein